MQISINAHAKINLFLDIVSLREDSYHNILSLMQAVTLHDVITLDYDSNADRSIEIVCNAKGIPCDEKNLAYKAADMLLERGCLKIAIEKNIPSEAGLAGGSADAAATLIGLNELLGNRYSLDELKTIGKKLGADVPFCLEGGSCIVEGIGEKMTKCAAMPDFPLVIARMGEGMSTPTAYRKLDGKFDKFKNYSPKSDMMEHLLGSDESTSLSDYCNGLYNIFEEVVEPERPEITTIKNILSKNGACGTLMTGSGTAVFGIFENEEAARSANSALLSIGAASRICYPKK